MMKNDKQREEAWRGGERKVEERGQGDIERSVEVTAPGF
jgi:hypothetical protein